MEFETSSHNNLLLSVASFCVAVVHFIYAHATRDNFGWLVGIVAGVVSIYAGLLAIKERKLSIKVKQRALKAMEENAKNHQPNTEDLENA